MTDFSDLTNPKLYLQGEDRTGNQASGFSFSMLSVCQVDPCRTLPCAKRYKMREGCWAGPGSFDVLGSNYGQMASEARQKHDLKKPLTLLLADQSPCLPFSAYTDGIPTRKDKANIRFLWNLIIQLTICLTPLIFPQGKIKKLEE